LTIRTQFSVNYPLSLFEILNARISIRIMVLFGVETVEQPWSRP